MQDLIYVAFTQKEGLALDCAPRQHSMMEYREMDKRMIRENPTVKRRF